MSRVLVVDDEPRIASFVCGALAAQGHVTEVAADGTTALAWLARGDFDLVVLDMGLPGRDGLSVLHELRGTGSTVPVIVLTGMAERDVVTCLEQGADDYMRKPFHLDELLARVRVRLRDHEEHLRPSGDPMVLEVDGIRLDARSRRVDVGDGDTDVTHREFMLLETLARHPGQALSREQLLSHVWGYSHDPGTNLVNVYVHTVRHKLGDGVIETVRGVGYRLGRGHRGGPAEAVSPVDVVRSARVPRPARRHHLPAVTVPPSG